MTDLLQDAEKMVRELMKEATSKNSVWTTEDKLKLIAAAERVAKTSLLKKRGGMGSGFDEEPGGNGDEGDI